MLGAAALLWRHVQRTNMELARFIDAVKFGDFSQGFSHRGQGSGFAELGDVLDEAIKRMRDERHKLIDANRFYEAVLDDAPTALLTVEADGKVELANKAARRLLMRHKGVRVEDFREYGDAFAKALEGGAVNRPRLVPLLSDGVPQTMLVSAAIVHRLGGLVRVVAVQPIQGELNAIEIAAQSRPDPRPHPRDHELDDPGHLARPQRGRSDARGRQGRRRRRRRRAHRGRDARPPRRRGHAFRRELPPDQPRARDPLAGRSTPPPGAASSKACSAPATAPAASASRLDADETLTLEADPDLMSQVLINLIRNAAQAARGHAERRTSGSRFSRTRSGRAQIEVADNGPGVPERLRQDIFLPFFTTKAEGTGVGLSLARQVVLAHRGSISVGDRAGGGALFRIVI